MNSHFDSHFFLRFDQNQDHSCLHFKKNTIQAIIQLKKNNNKKHVALRLNSFNNLQALHQVKHILTHALINSLSTGGYSRIEAPAAYSQPSLSIMQSGLALDCSLVD